jgi:guanylate kinase
MTRSGGAGRLVVISGPSGAGKTSVCRALKDHPEVDFSVSATTRKQRPGERDGIDYHFLSRAVFEARVQQHQFLEWASYNGNLYGTPRWPMDEALRAGRTFLLEIEVKGTRQLREQGVPGLYLFIAPPDLEALRERLIRRGAENLREIEQRLRIAEEELVAASVPVNGRPLYDHTIVNADLPATIRRVEELIWS